MKTYYATLLLGAFALPGFAQPAAPAPPAPPRVGRSVTARVLRTAGWLGVGLADLTPERVKSLKLKDDNGVEITRVDENSPASKAGLKEHDVVVEVNGEKVEDSQDFARIIAGNAPGTKVTLQTWRAGAKQTIAATLGSRPQFFALAEPGWVVAPEAPFPPEVLNGDAFGPLMGQTPRIGIEGESVDGQLAAFFGVKEGVLVRSVQEKSPAAKAGLKAGDVIVKVGGTPVANTREITGVMRAMHKTATFTVVRNRKEIVLNIEIAAQERPGLPFPDREVL